MTGLNCNCNTEITLNEPTLNAETIHNDANQANDPEPIDLFLNHKRAIDTLNSFLNITPSDDDFHPILALIADQLNRTFLDVIPVFASSSAKSWGPTNTSQQRAR
jgi:hypothetical protein